MNTRYLLLALIFWCNTSFGTITTGGAPIDNSYHWGDAQDEAKGNWMYLNSAIDEKDYQSALTPLYWLLNNSHDLNVALYVQGAKVLEANVKAEKDVSRKQVLQDSALWLYDERIRLYGDEAKVLNRKGRIAWKYLHKRAGKENELFALYETIYSENGEQMLIQNSTYYFRTGIAVYRHNKLEKANILTLYGEMMSFLDGQVITNPSKVSSIETNRTRINKEFNKYVKLDCQEIQTFYGTKYTENPNIEDAKKVNNLLVNKSCISNELFMSTNEFILEHEPSAKRYKVTAKIYLQEGDLVKSYDNFSKAIALESDNSAKYAMYLELAKIDKKNNDFRKSRENARVAAQLVSDNKVAYEFIGDLYLLSAQKCATSDVLKNKSVYISAYNMYKRAGNSTKMNAVKQQFPTAEEIFVRNKKEGDTINTGCWINETVTLIRR
jgi:hypothetical protein